MAAMLQLPASAMFQFVDPNSVEVFVSINLQVRQIASLGYEWHDDSLIITSNVTKQLRSLNFKSSRKDKEFSAVNVINTGASATVTGSTHKLTNMEITWSFKI